MGDRFFVDDKEGCYYIDLSGKYMKKLKDKFRFYRYLGDNFIISKQEGKDVKYYIMDKEENILSKPYDLIRFPADYIPFMNFRDVRDDELDFPKYLITQNKINK